MGGWVNLVSKISKKGAGACGRGAVQADAAHERRLPGERPSLVVTCQDSLSTRVSIFERGDLGKTPCYRTSKFMDAISIERERERESSKLERKATVSSRTQHPFARALRKARAKPSSRKSRTFWTPLAQDPLSAHESTSAQRGWARSASSERTSPAAAAATNGGHSSTAHARSTSAPCAGPTIVSKRKFTHVCSSKRERERESLTRDKVKVLTRRLRPNRGGGGRAFARRLRPRLPPPPAVFPSLYPRTFQVLDDKGKHRWIVPTYSKRALCPVAFHHNTLRKYTLHDRYL